LYAVGQIIGLRFRGVTSCDEAGDFAIDDVSLTDITAVDQGQRGFSNRLLVYPNPTSGEVTISLNNAKETTYRLQIIDLFGRDVVTEQVTALSGNLMEKLNLSALPAGIYLVQLIGDTEAFQSKLTIR